MIKIFRMQMIDLESVVSLAGQLGYPTSLEVIRKRFEKIHDKPDYALFVAKSEAGEVVGWIQVNLEAASLVKDPTAEIRGGVVDEKYRSQRIGALLMEKAEEWATAQHVEVIRVRSNSKREDAHRFYLRDGYTLSKVQNLFIKSLAENRGS